MIKQVAPSVFDDMYRNYLHQGCNVTLIDDDDFFNTKLCVDGEIIAKRVKPAMWKDENTPGYKKPEKKQNTNDIPFSIAEFIIGLISSFFSSLIFMYAAFFICMAIDSMFFSSFGDFEKPWYEFAFVDYGYIWIILFCGLWCIAYNSRNTDRMFFNTSFKILAAPLKLAFEASNKRSNTSRTYFFWTDFN